jgi:Uri superfamily endonuclease
LKNSVRHGPSAERNYQGAYTLIIRSGRPHRITVGRHLSIVLERGLYLYTGSALGRGSTSLEWRLSRHLSRDKKNFWHIDRILASDSAYLVSAIVARTKSRVECRVNTALLGDPSIRVLLKGIGSSDCKCESHFLMARCELDALQRKVRSCYASLGFRPHVFKDLGTHGLHGFTAQPEGLKSRIIARRIRTP